ncbi:MAG: PKD domain-containing protein [Patescibacteria group bacterium]|jgi:hypothetical protein
MAKQRIKALAVGAIVFCTSFALLRAGAVYALEFSAMSSVIGICMRGDNIGCQTSISSTGSSGSAQGSSISIESPSPQDNNVCAVSLHTTGRSTYNGNTNTFNYPNKPAYFPVVIGSKGNGTWVDPANSDNRTTISAELVRNNSSYCGSAFRPTEGTKYTPELITATTTSIRVDQTFCVQPNPGGKCSQTEARHYIVPVQPVASMPKQNITPPPSDVGNTTKIPAPTKPTLVASPEICENQRAKSTLMWNAVDHATSYKVWTSGTISQIQTFSDETKAGKSLSTTAQTSTLVGELTAERAINGRFTLELFSQIGIITNYRVEAIGPGGSTDSNVLSVMPKCKPKPTAFTFTTSVQCVAGQKAVVIKWTPSLNADQYGIMFDGGTSGNPTRTFKVLGSSNSFAVIAGRDLVPGTYKVWMGAQNTAYAWWNHDTQVIEVPNSGNCSMNVDAGASRFAASGTYSIAVLGKPASQQWMQLSIHGLQLNGGQLSVQVSDANNPTAPRSREIPITQNGLVQLSNIPEIAEAKDIHIVMLLKANAERTTTPRFKGLEVQTSAPERPTEADPGKWLTANPNYGPAPIKVVFTDNRSPINNPDQSKWEWDFGDGQRGDYAKTVTHTYEKPGTYNAVIRDKASTCSQPDCNGKGWVMVVATNDAPASALQTPMTEDATAILTTDKTNYSAGETITATYINTGQTGPVCTGPLSYSIVKLPEKSNEPEISILSSISNESDPLIAGAKRNISWDQRDAAGNQVFAGKYALDVDCNTLSRSRVSFMITLPSRTGERLNESLAIAPDPTNSLQTLPAYGIAPLTVTVIAPANLPDKYFGISSTYRINWGDGTFTKINAGQSLKHNYANQGSYVIRLERIAWIVPTEFSTSTITVVTNSIETTTLPTTITPALNPTDTPSLPTVQRDTMRNSEESTTKSGLKVNSSIPNGPRLPTPTQPRFAIPENITALQRIFVYPPQRVWNWLMSVFQLQ